MWAVVEVISCFEAVNLLSTDKPVIGDASEILLLLCQAPWLIQKGLRRVIENKG